MEPPTRFVVETEWFSKLVSFNVELPWVPETFLARFPVSVKSL